MDLPLNTTVSGTTGKPVLDEDGNPQLPGPPTSSIVDVGTDHGLFAVALAFSGKFANVLGVDVSRLSLRGAIHLWNSLLDEEEYEYLDEAINIDFRVSDGLENVERGEGDVVSISGIGARTILEILYPPKSKQLHESMEAPLDRVGCQYLLLQPASSRPRHLVPIYEALQQSGWELVGERIECISQRWFLSCAFQRAPDRPSDDSSAKRTIQLPTTALLNRPEDHGALNEYWDHHVKWIQRDDDVSQGRGLKKEEIQWREWVAQQQKSQP
eukprot:Nitzschia sp. Nitz4//scaffold212_size37733//11374//12183//NITZ4_007732-RA/size37733-processed-gene-0.32-mRNA-1//1//CDS//3329542019//5378//frame0